MTTKRITPPLLLTAKDNLQQSLVLFSVSDLPDETNYFPALTECRSFKRTASFQSRWTSFCAGSHLQVMKGNTLSISLWQRGTLNHVCGKTGSLRTEQAFIVQLSSSESVAKSCLKQLQRARRAPSLEKVSVIRSWYFVTSDYLRNIQFLPACNNSHLIGGCATCDCIHISGFHMVAVKFRTFLSDELWWRLWNLWWLISYRV